MPTGSERRKSSLRWVGDLRVKSNVFWDMEEWASGMYVIVRVRPGRGWRRFLGESAVETRGDNDDPVPPRATT
jgi:hypothetical protein